MRERLWIKIKVRFAKHRRRFLHPEPGRHRGADAQEARLHVLEINPVGNVFEQRAEQIALVGQRLLGLFAVRFVPENSLDADNLAGGVVERRLDDVDMDAVARRRLVGLDGVHGLTCLHHAQIVGVIFLREVRWKKIPIIFAEHFIQRLAERGAEFLIGESETALGVLAQNELRQRLDERLVEHFGVLERVLRAALLEEAALQFHETAAQFALHHDFVRENPQRLALLFREAALARVGHGQRADLETVGRAKRHSGVKAQPWLAGD